MKSRRVMWVSVLALVLVSLACGSLTGQGDATTAAPVEGGGPIDQKQTAPVEKAAPEVFSYKGIDQAALTMDTYTAKWIMHVEGLDANGQAALTHMEITVTEQQDPPASALYMDMESQGGTSDIPTGEVNIFTVGGLTYIEAFTGTERACFSTPQDQSDSYIDQLPNINDAIPAGSMPDLFLVSADENINGIASYHYHVDSVTSGDLQNAAVDIWVAQEGGYITKMHVEGEGMGDQFGIQSGTFYMTYELLSANQPVEVIPPTDCVTMDNPQP